MICSGTSAPSLPLTFLILVSAGHILHLTANAHYLLVYLKNSHPTLFMSWNGAETNKKCCCCKLNGIHLPRQGGPGDNYMPLPHSQNNEHHHAPIAFFSRMESLQKEQQSVTLPYCHDNQHHHSPIAIFLRPSAWNIFRTSSTEHDYASQSRQPAPPCTDRNFLAPPRHVTSCSSSTKCSLA